MTSQAAGINTPANHNTIGWYRCGGAPAAYWHSEVLNMLVRVSSRHCLTNTTVLSLTEIRARGTCAQVYDHVPSKLNYEYDAAN